MSLTLLIILPFVIIAICWIGVAMWYRAGAQRAVKFEQQGIDGTATIRQLAETGTYINMRPVYQFHLTVEVAGRQPYDVAVSEAVAPHAFAQLQVGARVPVKVMPDNPNQVQLRWGAVA